MDIYVRPESHETDTLARRKVPLAFPAAWEHRELTGRDYGIDMIVEIFKNGNATGSSLTLQIKGTSKNISTAERLTYDVPVRTLIYSEMFIVPVLLVVCPVVSEQNGFYYLWLQEYIKVVLNHENPNWRENIATVRVTIPIVNYMPGDENKLAFISDFPKRIFDWCQYARICEDLSYDLNSFLALDDMVSEEFMSSTSFNDTRQHVKNDLEKVISLIKEMIGLKGIFGDEDWSAPQGILKGVIIPALDAAQELCNDTSLNRLEAKTRLSRILTASSLLGIYNDYSFSRTLWKHDGIHNF